MNPRTTLQTVLLSSALVLLAACAGPSQTTLADGTLAYSIDCDGSSAGLQRCFERAGKSCGAEGYKLVAQDGRLITDASAAGLSSQSLVKIYEEDMNTIYFRCGS